MDWLGRAKVTFTHASTPLAVEEKSGAKTDLLKICEQATPPCQLNPLLFNGHLQTFWTVSKPDSAPIYYRRKVFDSDHPKYVGTFAVDFIVPPHKDVVESLPPRTTYFSEEAFKSIASDDDRPMLIVLHGIAGGSHEIYLRETIASLVNSGDWEICVVNSRGCAKSVLSNGVIFNARSTWDLRQTVRWARETFPNRLLFALGFSLGANILTNYLGEEGDRCPLTAAVGVGNPFNLEVTNKALKRTFLGKQVYQRTMGGNLRRLIGEHKKILMSDSKIDWDRIEKTKFIYDFDREVQCVIWGYPTEDAYYRDASCADAILAIRTPYFAISAKDDPIAVDEATPYQEFAKNPYTVLCQTSLGGHLGWFEPAGGRWVSRPIQTFFYDMATKVKLDTIKSDVNLEAVKSPYTTAFDPVRRKLSDMA